MKILKNVFSISAIFIFLNANAQKLLGFNEANAAKEVEAEKQFDAQLNPQNLDTWMKFLILASASCRLTAGQSQCRIHSQSIYAMGISNGDQHLLCFVPYTKIKRAGINWAQTIQSKAGRTNLSGR